MTAREKAFADAILRGKGPSESYRVAGYAQASSRLVSIKAQHILKRPDVKAYIEAGRNKLEAEDMLSRKEAVGILARIAKAKGNIKVTSRDRIAAVAQASRMLGYDAPTKVEAKLEGSILHQIRTG